MANPGLYVKELRPQREGEDLRQMLIFPEHLDVARRIVAATDLVGEQDSESQPNE